jgi:hypothetical protein
MVLVVVEVLLFVATEMITVVTLTRMVTITHVQVVVVEIVQGLGQALIRVVIRVHHLNRLRHGVIVETHHRLIHLLRIALRHGEVLRVAVHRVAVAVRQVVAEAAEEVHDKINKTLTIKIPLNVIFEGIFSFKVKGNDNFSCHISRKSVLFKILIH